MAKGKEEHESIIEFIKVFYSLLGYLVIICEEEHPKRAAPRPDIIIVNGNRKIAIEVGKTDTEKLSKLEDSYDEVLPISFYKFGKYKKDLLQSLTKIINCNKYKYKKEVFTTTARTGTMNKIRSWFIEHPDKWVSRPHLKKELPTIKSTSIDRCPDHLVTQRFLIKEGKNYKLR